jgi:RNA polymerase sigma factor (TIGR02999 family)
VDASPTPKEVTVLLAELAGGRASAADQLLPLVYENLRALASDYFRRERADHTLEPTALVHEAYLRLVTPCDERPRDRAHFFALAARVMRQVLVDHARKKLAGKRGGDRLKVTLNELVTPAADRAAEIEAVDRALAELAEHDEASAKLVEMRFFGGVTFEEAAEVLGASVSTVERRWRFARAWLADALIEDTEP